MFCCSRWFILSQIYWAFVLSSYLLTKKLNHYVSGLIYSRLSLSRLRLSRITAYLEVKIRSLLKHENITTGNKILWKRGEIAPKEQFLLFTTIYLIISNFRTQIAYSFVKCGCSIYFFLNSANLTCRGTDISKYFRESLGLRCTVSTVYCMLKYSAGYIIS